MEIFETERSTGLHTNAQYQFIKLGYDLYLRAAIAQSLYLLGYGLDSRDIVLRFPAGVNTSALHSDETGSGAMQTGVCFLSGRAAGA
jgi:hypothetical protein